MLQALLPGGGPGQFSGVDTFPAPSHAGAACIPNIGRAGRDRRLRSGLVWLVVGLALSVGCIALRPPWPVFALLYAVFFMAALGYFQASQKT